MSFSYTANLIKYNYLFLYDCTVTKTKDNTIFFHMTLLHLYYEQISIFKWNCVKSLNCKVKLYSFIYFFSILILRKNIFSQNHYSGIVYSPDVHVILYFNRIWTNESFVSSHFKNYTAVKTWLHHIKVLNMNRHCHSFLATPNSTAEMSFNSLIWVGAELSVRYLDDTCGEFIVVIYIWNKE